MYNKTSATLMLQTIMVLMTEHNNTDVTNFPNSFNEEAELERCYEPYGCFSKAYPWTEHRPDNYFPEPPQRIRVRYPVFTRRNRKIPVILENENLEKIQNANIDPSGPFYIITHGFLESGDKKWIQSMADALLSLEGNAAASVLVVDWRGGAQPPYGQATANIRLVGALAAHVLRDLYSVLGLSHMDNFHFIGHSLGAHLAGYCGHALQTKFNLKLGRITGLDPAAPYFSRTVTLVRLDRSDAAYVDVVHSNAMPLYYAGLGISEPIGHVDFYPNGGAVQPGCKAVDARAPADEDVYRWAVQYVGCSHERSYEYFTESIAPGCPFMAVQCRSYEAFLAGECAGCDRQHACLPLGYHSRAAYERLRAAGAAPGNIVLYSLTGGTKPYCRLQYAITVRVSNSSESRAHGPDAGRLAVTLIDKNNQRTPPYYLHDEQRYYRPGDTATRMAALRGAGGPPVAALLRLDYETNLFNPMSWRLLKSSSVYLDLVRVASLEYNSEITVCPKMRKPVVHNLPSIMKPKYCNI